MFENEETQQAAKTAILAHCPKWEDRGIASVVCMYDGSGDEGSISGFEYDEGGGNDLEPEDKILEDHFEALTFANVSYDNEGGGGTITVDVKNRTITREEYFYETTRTTASEETL